jgi:invasion protein IalB
MYSTIAFRAALWAVIPFLGSGSLSFGQTSKPLAPAATSEPPRASEAEPSSTWASYGDWIMRCQRLGAGDDAERVCEVAQLIHAQDQQNPVAEVAIGRLKKTEPLHLTIGVRHG